ncbi:MAG: DUF3597 family protein [Variovorax sp.]|nr:MAG: DUF3597 family protein [Variovorax sp.]
MNDSAFMNVWLHRQVMNKVAANDSKVPAALKDRNSPHTRRHRHGTHPSSTASWPVSLCSMSKDRKSLYSKRWRMTLPARRLGLENEKSRNYFRVTWT